MNYSQIENREMDRDGLASSVPCGTPNGKVVLIRWTSQMVASVHGIHSASVA
jgi:hypothetical protein